MPKQKVDAVHRHFSFAEETCIRQCKLCGNKLKGKHTSNLKSHLAAKHLSQYSEVVKINRASKNLNETCTKNDDQKNVIETLKHLCMQLIAIHGRPLALISDDPFRKILNMAAMAPKVEYSNSQQTKVINEKSVRILIPEAAYKIKSKIASETRETLISLKVDSATCLERKFFGVNIQYMKDNKIIVRNLSVSEIFQSQTAEFLKDKLLAILDEFYITTDQIYSVTTDNGSNMKKMVKLLEGSYCSDDLLDNSVPVNTLDENDSDSDILTEEDDLVTEQSEDAAHRELRVLQNALSTERYRVRGMLCAAHTLQLAIKDAINENVEVQASLDMVRRISRMLRSPTNRNLLKLANLKVPIIDCPTRWTSKYNMLVRLRSLKAFSENINEVSRLISDEFWEEIDQLIICLKPLYDSTLFLQREQLTIGDFYINWMNCKTKISDIDQPFASSLLKSMDNREKTLIENDMVLEALYLDGRVSIVLSQQQCQKAQVLLNETKDRLEQYISNCGHISTTLSEEEGQVSQEPRAGPSSMIDQDQEVQIELNRGPSTSYTDFTALEQMLLQTERARGRQQQTLSSFNACLIDLRTATRIPLETNIIEHWSNKATLNSELAMVARTIMAAPVTQVSVERMFSSLKFILSPLRSNLGSLLVEHMLLIRSNKDLLD